MSDQATEPQAAGLASGRRLPKVDWEQTGKDTLGFLGGLKEVFWNNNYSFIEKRSNRLLLAGVSAVAVGAALATIPFVAGALTLAFGNAVLPAAAGAGLFGGAAYYEMGRAAEKKEPHQNTIRGLAITVGVASFALFAMPLASLVLTVIPSFVSTVTSPLALVPIADTLVSGLNWIVGAAATALQVALPFSAALLANRIGRKFQDITRRADHFPPDLSIVERTGRTYSKEAIQNRWDELKYRKEKAKVSVKLWDKFKNGLINLALGTVMVLGVGMAYSGETELFTHISEHPTLHVGAFAAGFFALPLLRRLSNLAIGATAAGATLWMMGNLDPTPFVELFQNDASILGTLNAFKDVAVGTVGSIMADTQNLASNVMWPAVAGFAAFALPASMFRKAFYAMRRVASFVFRDAWNPRQAWHDAFLSKESFVELGNFALDALAALTIPFKKVIGLALGLAAGLAISNAFGLSNIGLENIVEFFQTGNFMDNIGLNLDGQENAYLQGWQAFLARTALVGLSVTIGLTILASAVEKTVNVLRELYYRMTGQTPEAAERREQLAAERASAPASALSEDGGQTVATGPHPG